MENNTLYFGKKWRRKTCLKKWSRKVEELDFFIYSLFDALTELTEFNIKHTYEAHENLFYIYGYGYNLLRELQYIGCSYRDILEKEEDIFYYEKTYNQRLLIEINPIINDLHRIDPTNYLIDVSKNKFKELVCMFKKYSGALQNVKRMDYRRRFIGKCYKN